VAEIACAGCGRLIAETELLCPHCGAAQIPQYTRRQLATVIGGAREGTPRAPMGVGCLLGLVLGVVLAAFALDGEGEMADPKRWRLQGEIVFLLMIGGLVLGLVYAQWRSLRRKRGRPPGAEG
jgi:hypothetical protein